MLEAKDLHKTKEYIKSIVFFGKNKLKSSDTTNTPVTAFPLNTSPTALGNAAKNHLYQYSLE